MQSLGAFSALIAAIADDLQKSSPMVSTNQGFAIIHDKGITPTVRDLGAGIGKFII